jgi:hypothetical protein
LSDFHLEKYLTFTPPVDNLPEEAR